MTWKQQIVHVLLFCSTFLHSQSYYLKDLEATPGVADTYLAVPKIIRKYGYPAEAHIVETEDGYLLECHRIPHGIHGNSSTKKPYPMFLAHGLFLSSENWISSGPNVSLAYLLADEGYDVWMINFRGNTYSRSHMSMTPAEPKFWNFTASEMARYDLTATIDYILNITAREKLVFIGYSIGNSVFYGFAASQSAYNDKILFQISLAPTAAIPHATSALRLLYPIVKLLQSKPLLAPILEHNFLESFLAELLCNANEVTNFILCEKMGIAALFGDDPEQFNTELLPVLTSYVTAGVSVKSVMHSVQATQFNDPTLYDYGLAGNIENYGTATPPTIDMSMISIPTKFYQGRNDIMATTLDSQLTYMKLQKPMGFTFIEFDKWNHIDFVFAKDIKRYVNEPVLQFIRRVIDGPESIDNIVRDAIEERDRNPIPVNEPFNETKFLNQFKENLVNNLLSSVLSLLTKYHD